MNKKMERVSTTCEKCHKPFSYNAYLYNEADKPKLCSECRRKALEAEAAEKGIVLPRAAGPKGAIRCIETCRDCGKNFAITAGEVTFYTKRGMNLPVRCGECREKRKAAELVRKARNTIVVISRVCKECGKDFDITAGEEEWFENHNMKLPTRCPECRKNRRKTAASAAKPTIEAKAAQ